MGKRLEQTKEDVSYKRRYMNGKEAQEKTFSKTADINQPH